MYQARFKRFKEECKKAYLIVREKANMFINLLNMMLSTGIPELKTHDDVAYLRNTLCLDMTEAEAAASFDSEIDKALKESWSVRVNWAAHIMAH
jgi:phosphatidylinositol-4,5-bisphosphate 3-kinase